MIAMCFSYCAEKPSKIKTYDAGIALAVEKDVLTFAIERRLAALERIAFLPEKKTTFRFDEGDATINATISPRLIEAISPSQAAGHQ